MPQPLRAAPQSKIKIGSSANLVIYSHAAKYACYEEPLGASAVTKRKVIALRSKVGKRPSFKFENINFREVLKLAFGPKSTLSKKAQVTLQKILPDLSFCNSKTRTQYLKRIGYTPNAAPTEIPAPLPPTISANPTITATQTPLATVSPTGTTPAPAFLSVSPIGSYLVSGPVGGPFSPSSYNFSVRNTGQATLNWTAVKSHNWLSLSSSSGSLAAGASQIIAASINTNANSLAIGSFGDSIQFTNTTNGNGSTTRAVQLSTSPAGSGMPCLSTQATQLGINATNIWFDRSLAGGAHTWIFEGGEFARAATAFCGNTSADVKLLEQIRVLLQPDNGLTVNGGFQDQKQLGSTSMFTLAKHIPRIWNQLTTLEQAKIDKMVYGALVSSSFMTSDHNPFVVSGGQQYTMDGGTNQHRDWNPNFRNGQLGTVVVASIYFGGGAQAQALLLAHDHNAFIAELQQLQLNNLVETYTFPSATRPSAQQINSTLHQAYHYYGRPLTDLMGLYLDVTEATYNRNVTCGLNNGQGQMGSDGNLGGYMAQNCNLLPNFGQLGMLNEFQSVDAGGVRSSAHYARDGFYVNNYIQYVLLALGYWENSTRAQTAMQRFRVGAIDLEFKLNPSEGGGYYNFAHGQGSDEAQVINNVYGDTINFSVAFDALFPEHGF